MSQILQKVAPIGESRDKALLKSAVAHTYTSPGGSDLIAHVFLPDGGSAAGRPAIAFFHGGFWDTPMVSQFVPHCHHFASRGAVAIAFEYRTSSKNGTGPIEAAEDTAAAFAWLVENASMLGIDPEKITVAGASGGAFLALQLAMRKPVKGESHPSRPAAAILFSALVNTTTKGQLSDRFPDTKTAKKASPINLLRRKLPPMLFLHGKSDRVTPFEEVATLSRKLRWRGNTCTLLDFSGAEHSFFNFNVSHTNFETTITAADSFLVDQSLLDPAQEDLG